MKQNGRKSAAKSARGVPFAAGRDVRRGRGPTPGAANAGRPPDEWREQLRALVSRDDTLRAVESVLGAGADHPLFFKALTYATEYGYGRPSQDVEVKVQQRAVVLLPPRDPNA